MTRFAAAAWAIAFIFAAEILLGTTVGWTSFAVKAAVGLSASTVYLALRSWRVP